MASPSDPDPERQNTESACPDMEKGPSQGSQPLETPIRRGFTGQILAPFIYAHPIIGSIGYVAILVLYYKGCRYRGEDQKMCWNETKLFQDFILIVLMSLVGWDILIKRRAQRRAPQAA